MQSPCPFVVGPDWPALRVLWQWCGQGGTGEAGQADWDAGERAGVVIARPEPENSVLGIVRAFSRKPRGYKLVMLGRYEPDQNAFHKAVLDAASEEVIFPGAIYDRAVVEAIASMRIACKQKAFP